MSETHLLLVRMYSGTITLKNYLGLSDKVDSYFMTPRYAPKRNVDILI